MSDRDEKPDNLIAGMIFGFPIAALLWILFGFVTSIFIEAWRY